VQADVLVELPLHPQIALGEVDDEALLVRLLRRGQDLGQRRVVADRRVPRARPVVRVLRERLAGVGVDDGDQHQVVEPLVVDDDPVLRIDDLEEVRQAEDRLEGRVPGLEDLGGMERLGRREGAPRSDAVLPGMKPVEDSQAAVPLQVGVGRLVHQPGLLLGRYLRPVEELLEGPADDLLGAGVDDQAPGPAGDVVPLVFVLGLVRVVEDRPVAVGVGLVADVALDDVVEEFLLGDYVVQVHHVLLLGCGGQTRWSSAVTTRWANCS
jgi:hypothetical protein